ncbi:hypothetical protein [Stieleria varia]|uniref:Uncharacterized protein n=1 Tax=Stieleria varia TaxID=2528005 RepID=A0A5C5ZKP1_9BACT|nr:hypothetical protein [Stieleria varia]TWT87800.1 hypothetical protein Pla52n_69940 [Stieleria varia]
MSTKKLTVVSLSVAGVSLVIWTLVIAMIISRRTQTASDGLVASESTTMSASPKSTDPESKPDLETIAKKAASELRKIPTPSKSRLAGALEGKFPFLRFWESSLDWAYDDVSGNMAMFGYEKYVAIFDLSKLNGKDIPPTEIDLTFKPQAIGLKKFADKSYFLVVGERDLMLIDAHTKKVVKTGRISFGDFVHVFDCVDRKDPTILAKKVGMSRYDNLATPIQKVEGRHGSSNTIAINIETLEKTRAVFGLVFGVSPDRSECLFITETPKPKQMRLGYWPKDPTKMFKATASTEKWPDSASIRLIGDVVAFDNVLYNRDLQEIGKTAFPAQAQMPGTAYLACSDGFTFEIVSVNDLKPLFTYRLPKGWDEILEQSPTREVSPRVICDAKYRRFLFYRRGHLIAFPLDQLGLAPLSSVHFTWRDHTQLEADSPWQLQLTGNGELGDLSLEDAPSGLTIDGSTLAWVPTSQQLGTHTFSIIHKLGQSQQKRSMTLTVQQDPVQVEKDSL